MALTRAQLVAQGPKVAEIVLRAWYGSGAVGAWKRAHGGTLEDDQEYPIDLPPELLEYMTSIYPSWGRE